MDEPTLIVPTSQVHTPTLLKPATNRSRTAWFQSSRFRHQFGDVRQWVRLSFCNRSSPQIKPAISVAVRFHTFGNDFPVVDFGLIHHKNWFQPSILEVDLSQCGFSRSWWPPSPMRELAEVITLLLAPLVCLRAWSVKSINSFNVQLVTCPWRKYHY